MRILGISCFYHDSAACLVEDGVVIAAADEERFSRIKHDSAFPIDAVNFCLEFAGIKIEDVDWIVFYEKPFLKFERITLSFLATAPFARGSFVDAYKTWIKDKLWIKSTIASKLKIKSSKIVFSGHHLSHAASSYYTSDFENAALLTVDGVGEWTTTAWGEGKDNQIKLHQEIKFPHSLGLFYSVFTQYLGFQVNEGEYKVMGLAPYGKPKYYDQINNLIDQSDDGSFSLKMDYFNFHLSDQVSFNKKFIELFNLPPVNPNQSDEISQEYADIAASAQKVLEDKLLKIAKYIRQKTKQENLCYAGGVALNGVANWRIFKEAGFKKVFIHPAAGDSGGALGAALYMYHHVLNNKRKDFNNLYLGAENDKETVDKFIKDNKIKAKKMVDKDLIEKVAGLLAKGKVIGWVQGRFEWGPRALGSRSILADPRKNEMRDRVNSKIKFREGFRPFAPSVLYEEADKYFEVGKSKDIEPLQYMLAVVPVKKAQRSNLGAITHIDGTARPQFVKRTANPKYYDLIKSFGKKTGIPVILNTSFNLKGEPIVNTCDEAYKTFLSSGLDALVLENYLIEK